MSQQGALPHMNRSDEIDQSYFHAWPYELEILEIKLVDRHYKNQTNDSQREKGRVQVHWLLGIRDCIRRNHKGEQSRGPPAR